MIHRVAVVTISDSVHAGKNTDLSGPAVCRVVEALGWTQETHLVPDVAEEISSLLRNLADRGEVDVILTTGGTGIAMRDVTPEATRAVIDREIPGLGEVMRSEGRTFTPRAALSRALAGTRGRTLIVNLPGSPNGAVQSLESVVDLLPHTVDLLKGNTSHAGGTETAMTSGASEQ